MPDESGAIAAVVMAIILVLREVLPYINKKRKATIPPPSPKPPSGDFPWAALAKMAKHQQEQQPVSQKDMEVLMKHFDVRFDHASDSIAGLHKEVHEVKTAALNHATTLAEHTKHDDERFTDVLARLGNGAINEG